MPRLYYYPDGMVGCMWPQRFFFTHLEMDYKILSWRKGNIRISGYFCLFWSVRRTVVRVGVGGAKGVQRVLRSITMIWWNGMYRNNSILMMLFARIQYVCVVFIRLRMDGGEGGWRYVNRWDENGDKLHAKMKGVFNTFSRKASVFVWHPPINSIYSVEQPCFARE